MNWSSKLELTNAADVHVIKIESNLGDLYESHQLEIHFAIKRNQDLKWLRVSAFDHEWNRILLTNPVYFTKTRGARKEELVEWISHLEKILRQHPNERKRKHKVKPMKLNYENIWQHRAQYFMLLPCIIFFIIFSIYQWRYGIGIQGISI